MAYAAARDQDLHCAACPAGWPHIAHGRVATCRYCGQEVVLGKHGWRLDTNGTGGEACQAAPRGYHGVDKQPAARPLADLIAHAEAAAGPASDARRDEGPYRDAGLSTPMTVVLASGGQPPAAEGCRVYWGSHGCHHPRGHSAEIPHECDCCECRHHPDPDPDNLDGAPSCVAKPPYYGEGTTFYGEDAEALGLPLVRDAKGAR